MEEPGGSPYPSEEPSEVFLGLVTFCPRSRLSEIESAGQGLPHEGGKDVLSGGLHPVRDVCWLPCRRFVQQAPSRCSALSAGTRSLRSDGDPVGSPNRNVCLHYA